MNRRSERKWTLVISIVARSIQMQVVALIHIGNW